MPCPRSSPADCCPARSRSWTPWRSRPPRPPSMPSIRRAAKPCSSSNSKARAKSSPSSACGSMPSSPRSQPVEMRPARDAEERARDLEGPQERLQRRGPALARFHRAGRRGAAPPPGRGAAPHRRDVARGRHPRARTSFTPATATCIRSSSSMAAKPARSSAPRSWRAASCSMCVEMGGSITGEHGVGVEKRDYLPRHVQRRRDRLHEAPPRRLRSARHRQSRQDVPRRRSARACRSTGCIRWKRPASSRANDLLPPRLAELARRRASRRRACSRSARRRSRASRRWMRRRSRRCGLRGIVEYEPGEFTFTALAGTPVREIVAALASEGAVSAVRSDAGRGRRDARRHWSRAA